MKLKQTLSMVFDWVIIAGVLSLLTFELIDWKNDRYHRANSEQVLKYMQTWEQYEIVKHDKSTTVEYKGDAFGCAAVFIQEVPHDNGH